MTEDTGFTEPEPEDVPAGPAPDAEPVAEPEPDADAPAEPEPAADVTEPAEVPADSPTVNAPEPMPEPDLPAEGVPDAIRAALMYLHERLVRLGG